MHRTTLRRALVALLTVGIIGLLPGVAAAHESYEVQSGDTVIEIAKQFDLPAGAWRAIVRDNPEIEDPSLIYPGWTLRIPVTPTGLALDSLGAAASGDTDEATATSSSADSSETTESSASSYASTNASASVWERLAMCESTGRWHLNVGTFDGGLQFHPDTWTAFGGGEYATYAWQATKAEQIAVAERVLAAQGWGAWPACSAELGLR